MSTHRSLRAPFTLRQKSVSTLGGMETHTCPLCALARSTDDATGLGWSSQHESDGTITWICPTCTRAQLWLIEAGLPIATWNAPARAVPLPDAA